MSNGLEEAVPDISDVAEVIARMVTTGKHQFTRRELEDAQRKLVMLARDATVAVAQLYTLIRVAK